MRGEGRVLTSCAPEMLLCRGGDGSFGPSHLAVGRRWSPGDGRPCHCREGGMEGRKERTKGEGGGIWGQCCLCSLSLFLGHRECPKDSRDTV